jgi:hypothetical protein
MIWCYGASQADEPPHILHRDLIRAKAKDAPTGQSRLQIFLQIGVEPCGTVVAAVHPDAAHDLNQHTSAYMRKISPPTALVVEAVLPLQVRSFDVVPEH